MGHKRTSKRELAMSALLLKADMYSAEIDVRFVPLTDISNRPFGLAIHLNLAQRDRSCVMAGLAPQRRPFVIHLAN
jgi:hypothetical protein